MFSGRVLRAIVLSGLAVLMLWTHGFVAFDALRVKLVQTPIAAAAGQVRAATVGYPLVNDLRPPFAVIARIHSDSPGVSQYAVTVDGTPVCERAIRGGASRRIDCAIAGNWIPGTAHVVTIQSASTPWRLEYLELATHHGATSGLNHLVILPRESDHYTRPDPIWIAIAWLTITGILLLPAPAPPSRRVLLACRCVVGVVVTLVVAIQTAQWISAYRIVFSAGTFIMWMVVLLAPRLWLAARWLLRREPQARPLTAAIRATLVALLVLAAYDGIVRDRLTDDYHGNYSGFLLVSARIFDGNPLLNRRDDVRRSLVLMDGGGYDGQFMYFSAFDPFLRAFKDAPANYRLVMDAPPYRFGRIGLALLTRVFSAGEWQRYPVTTVWLILWSLCGLAFLLALMAQRAGMTPAFGALVIVIPGFWASLQAGLPEPIAAATLVGGILCMSRGRWAASAALFAVSLLVRETGVVAVGCVLLAAAFAGRRREAISVGVLALGVVALWRLYVTWMLFPDWGLQGLFYHPPDLGWPLAGILDLWRAIARGQYYPGVPELSRAGIVYPLLLIAGLLIAVAMVLTSPSAAGAAALVYAAIAVCLNFPAIWVYVNNGQRGSYELFVMLALCTLGIRSYSRPLRAALWGFWLCTAAYVFFFTVDAAAIRSAIRVPFPL